MVSHLRKLSTISKISANSKLKSADLLALESEIYTTTFKSTESLPLKFSITTSSTPSGFLIRTCKNISLIFNCQLLRRSPTAMESKNLIVLGECKGRLSTLTVKYSGREYIFTVVKYVENRNRTGKMSNKANIVIIDNNEEEREINTAFTSIIRNIFPLKAVKEKEKVKLQQRTLGVSITENLFNIYSLHDNESIDTQLHLKLYKVVEGVDTIWQKREYINTNTEKVSK